MTERVAGTFRCRAAPLAAPHGRPLRATPGGLAYHVLNRASDRATLFADADDFALFERALADAHERAPVRILAYCVMPNHWHLLLWPERDGALSPFVGRLTLLHTQRHHARRRTAGSGHLYQGRFKSFVVQADEHLLTVWRYIERNPLRANLVRRAEDWRRSSLWRREAGGPMARALLSDGPLPLPTDWPAWVNGAETAAELEALRHCVACGRPFGAEGWVEDVVRRLGLEVTTRPRGRPRRKQPPPQSADARTHRGGSPVDAQ